LSRGIELAAKEHANDPGRTCICIKNA